MRTVLAVAALSFLVLVLPMTDAGAQDFSSVPTNLAQIADPVFRDAMSQYKPNYDTLDRGGQIAAYVNMHQVLNNGLTPPLTAHESGLLSRSLQAAQPAPRELRYDPWADPSYDPYKEEYGILSNMGFGFGW